MDKDAISAQLKELATGDKSRGKTALLRDVFDDVEFALSSGVSRALVLETLAKNGLEMTAKGFDSALSRLRAQKTKERALRPSEGKMAPPPPTTSNVRPQAPCEATGGSHDPADLDKIFSQKPDLAALAKLAKPKR